MSLKESPHRPRIDRLLTALFAFLLAGPLFYMLVGFASLPRYYQRVTTGGVPRVVVSGVVQVSNELVVEMAAERGLTLAQYANYRIALSTAATLVPILVGAVIIWRVRRKWFALFTAFILTFLGVWAFSEQILVGQIISLEVFGSGNIFWFLVLLYIYLFPNGTAVPRRAGWAVFTLVAYHFFIQVGTVIVYVAPDFAAELKLPNWGEGSYAAPILVNFLLVLGCQVYRYLRVSTLVERQQTKWFLFGFGLVVAVIPLSIFLDVTEKQGLLTDIGDQFLWIPLYLSLAIATLRYRLFDIDVLIRKTLIYTIITATLAIVYFGTVVLLQTAVGRTTGEQSPLIIVFSTLLIAALFSPLRHRIQDFIDRRFYRRKYDATRTLTQFALTARDEVEIDKLSTALLVVVQETVQPRQVGLWLRKKP